MNLKYIILCLTLFTGCDTIRHASESNINHVNNQYIGLQDESNRWVKTLVVQWRGPNYIYEKIYYVYKTKDGRIFVVRENQPVEVLGWGEDPITIAETLGQNIHAAYFTSSRN